MNKLAYGLLLASVATVPAWAASSKFAAISSSNMLLTTAPEMFDAATVSLDSGPLLNSVIRTANKKDLLIGVSLEVGIYTDTQVKGKNGEWAEADAKGGVKVTVLVDGVAAEPGVVTFSERYQELSATLGGVIESCDVTTTPAVDENGEPILDENGLPVYEGTIDISEDCVVTDEDIKLVMETTAAHHFNFIMPDLEPGDHTIEVMTTIAGENNATEGSTSKGYAWIGKGALTIQEVQAVNIKDLEASGGVLEMF